MCEVSRVCRIDEVFFRLGRAAALVLSLLRFVNMLLSVCLLFPFFGSGFREKKAQRNGYWGWR